MLLCFEVLSFSILLKSSLNYSGFFTYRIYTIVIVLGGGRAVQRLVHVGGHQPEVRGAGPLPPVVRHRQGAQHRPGQPVCLFFSVPDPHE